MIISIMSLEAKTKVTISYSYINVIVTIVFQKFSCTRLEKERRVKRTFSYVVEQFDR